MTTKKIIYCKLPNGLVYTLQDGKKIELRGKKVNEQLSADDFGRTEVDEQDWAQILQVYGQSDVIKNRFIFAADTSRSGDAQAKEMTGEKTGLEQKPLNGEKDVTPDDDPQVAVNTNLAKQAAAKEAAAKAAQTKPAAAKAA